MSVDTIQLIRQRKAHKNSHTGCLTCKQRRVKCDEERPTCRRCQRAHRECRRDPRLSQVTCATGQTAFHSSPTLAIELSSCAQPSLQHFRRVTLPAFDACEPSPLWDYMSQELEFSSSIRCMAVALGHEHQKVNSASDFARASTFYIDAVHSLRQTIEVLERDKPSNFMFTVAFHCLLLVILQCFRRCFDEVNIHLQHGLTIAVEARSGNTSTAPLLEASFRLLKQYSIAIALFNPLLPQSAIRSGIATSTTNQALSDPAILRDPISTTTLMKNDQYLRDEEQNLLLDLISTTVTDRRPHMNQGQLEFSKPLDIDAAFIDALRVRQKNLELAIQRSRDENRVQHIEIAEARCMILGIYLRCRWSGYACNYDLEYNTFEIIVDKIESSLKHQRGETLSIGLGVVAPLFYTVIMCRQPEIRRRAIDMLSTGPQQDGPWNSRLAEVIGRAIIAFEEQKAANEIPGYCLTGYIPEHCRVAYYYYHASQHKEHLRVFRRQPGSDANYIHEDIELAIGNAR